jgi:hypothetical protein
MGNALLCEADIYEIAGDGRIQDLRLGEALGLEQAYGVRKSIDRYDAELKRHGEVFSTVAKTSRLGGRPGTEYWLNEAQALVICMRSDAPNAPIIRTELIRIFMAWRHGHLIPTTAAPFTLQQIGDLFDEKLAPVRAEFRSEIISLRQEIERRHGRKQFSERDVISVWVYVNIIAYRGKCPTGCGIQIIDGNGVPIPRIFSCDHWYRPDRVGLHDGWPTALECNQRLWHEPEFKTNMTPKFASWTDMVKIHCPGGKIPLPGTQMQLF